MDPESRVARLREERQRVDAAAEPGRMARIHLELTLAYRESGDEIGARKAYPRGLEFARKAEDVSLQLRFLRLCRLFLEPDTARRHLEYAAGLAHEKGLELEQALCLNNLAVVSAELRLFEVAAGHWRACLGILEAQRPESAAVPLNNLGFLALSQGDLDAAGEFLGQARRVAVDADLSLRVRSNLAVLRARRGLGEEAVRELEILRQKPECPPSVRPGILFNLARALLEVGRGEEALQEAVVPPPWVANDEDLARAALAAVQLRAYRLMGKAAEECLQRQAKVLEVTTKTQAWLYQTLWARGDAQFLTV